MKITKFSATETSPKFSEVIKIGASDFESSEVNIMLEIRKIVSGCGSVSVKVCLQHWKRNANTPKPKQANPNPFSSVFPTSTAKRGKVFVNAKLFFQRPLDKKTPYSITIS
jgi:hypothetical protein